MSHQTGIQANEQLKQFISKCKGNAKTRVFKISIKSEELIVDDHKDVHGSWEEDYKKFVSHLVQPKQPCYLLFRLDSKDASNLYEWILVCWSPEDSPVREKMLYASTKATLKTTFGTSSIICDFHGSNKDEISLDAYQQREHGIKSPDREFELLTMKEQDLKQVKREEAMTSSVSNRTLPGLQFPLADEAVDALLDLRDGVVSYVQLAIDLDKEVITLEERVAHKDFDIGDIASKMPENSARYHLIFYPHTHEGVFTKSILFIYSVPGNNCSVKERMLYSSCKLALVGALQDKFGIEIDRKLESDDPKELTPQYLLDELHPKQATSAAKFEKPKGPAGKRGAKRLIKTNE